MVLRTAAGVDTDIYAVGLDVGGNALEVAQRGFSSMLANRMGQLGRWTFDGPRPTVRIADDLVGHLLERERSSRFQRAVVGIACPAWFGLAERHHLAEAIDPRRRHTLISCTTTVAAAVGTNLSGVAGNLPLDHELVLALDLDVGFSASVVEVGHGIVRERCSVGLSPRQLRGEHSGVGIVPGTRQRDLAMAALVRDAAATGSLEVARVVAVGEDSVAEVTRMLASVHPEWADRRVDAVRTREDVARGAAFLADPVAGTELYRMPFAIWESDQFESDAFEADAFEPDAFGSDPLGPDSFRPDAGSDVVGPDRGGSHPAYADGRGARSSWHVGGVLVRSIGVLTDDGDEAVVQSVVERATALPVSCAQPFDVGPDDGMDVFLDVYEQRTWTDSTAPDDHRVIVTARHRADSHDGAEVTVTFSIGEDGRFEILPAEAWEPLWHETEVDIVAVPRRSVGDAGWGARLDRAPVRPLVPARPRLDGPAGAVGAPMVRTMGDEATPTQVSDRAPDPRATVRSPGTATTDADAPPETASVAIEPARAVAAAPATPATTSPIDPAALVPTPAIAGALQRCERLLSHEVGRLLAVRSAHALLDCDDDAPVRELIARADRLERAVADRADDLADALCVAVAAIRRAGDSGGDDWYFGGTAADVRDELARVVEHLMVVVGFVSPAEHRRLVLDARLLGLGVDRANDVVGRLVAAARGGPASVEEPAEDASGGVASDGVDHRVVYDAGTRRFVLTDAPDHQPDDRPAASSCAIRVALELR